MNEPTHFRKRLLARETLIGTVVTIQAPSVAEMLAQAGFDFLWIDLEHAPISIPQAQLIIQAVAARSACLIRVPELSEIWIKQALDIGADGVIVPQVNTAEQARQVAEWSWYPPQGKRGVGLARAQGYGMNFQEYLDRANESLVVLVQVEHIESVENIAAIIQVVGIDGIVVGPYDLSASLGLLGQVNHPEVQAAIEKVRTACLAAGMPLGIFNSNPQEARQNIEKGFSINAVSTDAQYLWGAAQSIIAAIHIQ